MTQLAVNQAYFNDLEEFEKFKQTERLQIDQDAANDPSANAPKIPDMNVFIDGTWQTSKQANPTNIYKISTCLADKDANGNDQNSVYFSGVGTNGDEKEAENNGRWARFKNKVKDKLSDIYNGVTGADIEERILDAYEYIAKKYIPGQRINLAGFSRGSYTARSLAGMIYKCGIMDGDITAERLKEAYSFYKNSEAPSDDAAKEFRSKNSHEKYPKINLTCFDTVGALGIPLLKGRFLRLLNVFNQNKKHQFHDTSLSRIIDYAYHAGAIDEHRDEFDITPFDVSEGATTKVEEEFFAGTHEGIGGGSEGGKYDQLSDIPALHAMLKWQENSTTRFDLSKIKEIFEPNALAHEGDEFKADWIHRLTGQTTNRKVGKLSPAAIQRGAVQDSYPVFDLAA